MTMPTFPKIVRRPKTTMEGFVSLDEYPPLIYPAPNPNDFQYITDIFGEPGDTGNVLELLRDFEWSGLHTDYEDSWGVLTRACPSCFNAKKDSHKENCKLAEAIRRGA